MLRWDPHLRQNTLSSAQKHDQDPSLPPTQMGKTKASYVPLGPVDTQYRYVCIYIYFFYIDCI